MVFAAIFYRRYQAHQRLCKNIQQSLYEPVQKNESDYSIYVPTALTVGEYLWQIYTIDPDVVQAIDFSSTENLDSPFHAANYLMNTMLNHDEDSLQGFRNRLIGYMGEQKVASVLAQHGENAVWASTSNQQLWDLKIDDQLVNVKTVLDVQSIQQTAIAHPEVTYLVPEDRYRDLGVNNIKPLAGFNYADVNADLDSAYAQSDGTAAFDGLTTHLPIASGFMALQERQRLINAGGDQQSINKNVSIDLAAKTAGSLTMAKIGGVVGAGLGSLVFMPVAGAIVGAALGAFWGAKKGKEFGKKIKELELNRQNIKLEELLDQFGRQYLIYLPKIKAQLFTTTHRSKTALDCFAEKFGYQPTQKSWKKSLFKDPNDIFYQELRKIGETSYQRIYCKAQQQSQIFDQIEQRADSKALAIVILNNAHLRDFLYVDLMQVKKIYAQKSKTYYERYKLYPDQYPLTQDFNNRKKLYGEYI